MTSNAELPSASPTVYIVALDGTSSAQRVLEVACDLGTALPGAAELHLIHVLGVTPPAAAAAMGPVVTPTELLEGGRRVLDDASAYAAGHFEGRIIGHLAAGEPSREITQLASSLRADLVIVGTAGKTGLARLALGSVAEKVVRNAGCPVLVVRPKDYHARAVPQIEPPCGDCIAVQQASSRQKLWCDRHGAPHAKGRLHYEVPPSFAVGTMLLRP